MKTLTFVGTLALHRILDKIEEGELDIVER